MTDPIECARAELAIRAKLYREKYGAAQDALSEVKAESDRWYVLMRHCEAALDALEDYQHRSAEGGAK